MASQSERQWKKDGDTKMFVLDCSATMAWFFEEEATKYTQALWRSYFMHVPKLSLLSNSINFRRRINVQ
jgi:predicted nucleic acid-binding protein